MNSSCQWKLLINDICSTIHPFTATFIKFLVEMTPGCHIITFMFLCNVETNHQPPVLGKAMMFWSSLRKTTMFIFSYSLRELLATKNTLHYSYIFGLALKMPCMLTTLMGVYASHIYQTGAYWCLSTTHASTLPIINLHLERSVMLHHVFCEFSGRWLKQQTSFVDKSLWTILKYFIKTQTTAQWRVCCSFSWSVQWNYWWQVDYIFPGKTKSFFFSRGRRNSKCSDLTENRRETEQSANAQTEIRQEFSGGVTKEIPMKSLTEKHISLLEKLYDVRHVYSSRPHHHCITGTR